MPLPKHYVEASTTAREWFLNLHIKVWKYWKAWFCDLRWNFKAVFLESAPSSNDFRANVVLVLCFRCQPTWNSDDCFSQ